MILFLNGPSSCGKTTLARALQAVWPRPLYYLSYDSAEASMAPFRYRPHEASAPDAAHDLPFGEVRDFLSVMYLTAAAIDRSGRDAVADNCFFDTEDIYPLALRLTEGCAVFFIRIDIGDGELVRRETARGDRQPGKALWQKAHLTPKEDAAYDLILRGEDPAEDNARRILDAVREKGGVL